MYPILSFNRGRVSQLALARLDLSRVAVSGDVMTNFIPRVLGPMSLRPGWKYLFNSYSNNTARYLPFIFSVDDTALIELTSGVMRVIVDDEVISRETVTAAVTNGGFDSDIASWTDNSDAGGSVAWATGGYAALTGNGSDAGALYQEITVNEPNVEHALNIVINRGPVGLTVGSTLGDDDYINETYLETGGYSLAFTPTGNFFVEIHNHEKRVVYVDSIEVASAGELSFSTIWTATELDKIRFDQSGDVIFVACDGLEPKRIERRGTTSWGIARYAPEDGPFMPENTSEHTMTPSAISGNITLTSSTPEFKSTSVGSLYSITSEGQTVTVNVTAENTWSNAIRVFGIEGDRIFTIDLTSSTWAVPLTIITLQRSFTSDSGPWVDVPTKTWTADTTESYDDGLDNLIVWYRIGCATGDYLGAGDDIDATLLYDAGSITGVVRVTGYTSSTVVSAEVLSDLGGTAATALWAEGKWNPRRGYPSSVTFHDGRLWWAGKDSIIGSVSDAYDSFDVEIEGDSGPINRTLAKGPVDTIQWLLSLQRLLVGGQGAEFSIRASAFDSPLTPTDFTIRRASTQGSAEVEAVEIDQNGVFVQRGKYKVYELSFDGVSADYSSVDLTALVPEMGSPGITRIAVQRQPDTRVHCVRSDGTVMMMVREPVEDVLAWVDIETDGQIEDVVILPGEEEDQVYYSVRRAIDGSIVRFLEKWAMESDCRGGTVSKLADSFVQYSGVPTATITGLSHLEGEDVVVWADGEDVGTESDYTQTYTVSGGQIVLAAAASDVIVGLPYTAQWRSTKILANEVARALGTKKMVNHLALVLGWVSPKALRFGPSFDVLDDMPDLEEEAAVTGTTDHYAQDPIVFPGQWLTDARICLQAQAPRSVTALGFLVDE